ncbi:hypothetical protein GPL02_10295 [Clostridium sp. MCC334]|nr:hypothetical protein [Clostridium sp. MCC334]
MARVKSSCAIYVVFGGRKVKIPVNPEEIETSCPTDHKTYDVIGLGEIVVPRRPSLREVSWESFFPGDRSEPYVNTGAGKPAGYLESFETAMKEKQVCRLVISGSGVCDTNMQCVITDFETKNKGGEPGDLYYSVGFQEYRPYAPKILTILKEGNDGQGNAEASAESERPVEKPVLRVGASVVVNGEYCYDSYGSRPHGTANNLSTTVTRIVSGNPYPVHVGHYGWVLESQLQIMG